MKTDYRTVALTLGIAPVQVLVELAAMKQPIEDCWPTCDEGFEDTIRARRRSRAGFGDVQPNPRSSGVPTPIRQGGPLVSRGAAGILDKLLRKNYGLKSVRISTLTRRWLRGSSEDDVLALVRRGNLAWSDDSHQSVALAPAHLQDTEAIVTAYRKALT